MSTSPSGKDYERPNHEISIHEQAMRFESAFFRTEDALRRARDAWSITEIESTKWDYVHKQILRALEYVSQANIELMALANAVDEATDTPLVGRNFCVMCQSNICTCSSSATKGGAA